MDFFSGQLCRAAASELPQARWRPRFGARGALRPRAQPERLCCLGRKLSNPRKNWACLWVMSHLTVLVTRASVPHVRRQPALLLARVCHYWQLVLCKPCNVCLDCQDDLPVSWKQPFFHSRNSGCFSPIVVQRSQRSKLVSFCYTWLPIGLV